MGVQLNIKDSETVRLARELAGRTGLSLTETMRGALARDLEQRAVSDTAKIRAVIEISEDFVRNMPPEWRNKTSKEIMDDLYDEDGLPR